MKRLLILLIVGLFPITAIFAQNLTNPSWVLGTWNNSAESNTNNFEYWTFYKDSIIFFKGFPLNSSNKTNLSKEYDGYQIIQESNDSIQKIKFQKSNELIVYEFKIHKVSYCKEPVLTYSLVTNGIVKRQHSTSCNLILTKNN